jgi:uncharacterized protein (DUF1501 family)
MKRRTFLQSLGVGAGAFMLSSMLRPRSARAAVDRSFVFCYFRGGWDTLLSLDPRDPDVFTEARRNQTLIELGWDQLADTYPKTIQQPAGSNIDFGPVMGGVMHHYDKMCVVRGMTMDTVAHEVGRKYFITGMAPRGTAAAGSAVPTRIVSQQGDMSAFPNLVVGVETYNDGDPSFASGLTVNTVADLITTLTDGPSAPDGAVRAHLDSYRGRAADCDPANLDKRGLFGLLRSSQLKARELVSSGLSSKFQFLNANDPEMTAISARYGVLNLASVQAQAAMAYQALKYEMAQCVTIEAAGDLDTHDADWSTDQPDGQFAGWSAIGKLLDDLSTTPDPSRGGMLIDHTTILAFSEFGRTALLNGRGGRDHSLTSSCALFGAGVPGNKVIGKSSDTGMTPVAVNPTTGAPDDLGVLVNPNLVVASILGAAGLDTAKLRTEGLPCLMA